MEVILARKWVGIGVDVHGGSEEYQFDHGFWKNHRRISEGQASLGLLLMAFNGSPNGTTVKDQPPRKSLKKS
ncbi:hypothetical protein PanWU01x14_352320, partial [Parasponia andersonii]